MDDINIPLNSNNLNGEVILPKKKGGMIVWGLVTLLLVVTAVFATLIISAKVASKTPVAPTAPESSPKAFEPITEEIFTTEEVDQEVPVEDQSVVDETLFEPTEDQIILDEALPEPVEGI